MFLIFVLQPVSKCIIECSSIRVHSNIRTIVVAVYTVERGDVHSGAWRCTHGDVHSGARRCTQWSVAVYTVELGCVHSGA